MCAELANRNMKIHYYGKSCVTVLREARWEQCLRPKYLISNDPNHSISSPYENVFTNKILRFLELVCYFFRWEENRCFWTNHNCQIKSFFPIRKNSKPIPKNVKFGLLMHFLMEIRLNGSDQSYLV
jgi:hypothetical protein